MGEIGSGNTPIDAEVKVEDEASRLARLTREQGMGKLYGKFPYGIAKELAGGWSSVKGFIKGGSADKPDSGGIDPRLDLLVNSAADSDLQDKMVADSDYQYWIVSSFNPLYEVKTHERKGLFGKREIIAQRTREYEGESLGDLVVQYEYRQPVDKSHDIMGRFGIGVSMLVVVPVEVSRQLDRQVNQDPLFPDKYFKALYPGLLGIDAQNQIKRTETKGIKQYDFRVNPSKPIIKTITYSAPLVS